MMVEEIAFGIVRGRNFNGKKKYIGKHGTLVSGERFKNIPLFKVVNENMTMRSFHYKIGLNVDTSIFDETGTCERGLYFSLAEHIPHYLDYGSKLCLIKIPENETVYVDYGKFRSHSLEIAEVYDLNSEEAWEHLLAAGIDIVNSRVVVEYLVANKLNNILKKVNFKKCSFMDTIVLFACMYGNAEILKHIHEVYGVKIKYSYGRAPIASDLRDYHYHMKHHLDYCPDYVFYAIAKGHTDILKYFKEVGLEFDENYVPAACIALKKFHYIDTVIYLLENGMPINRCDNSWDIISTAIEMSVYDARMLMYLINNGYSERITSSYWPHIRYLFSKESYQNAFYILDAMDEESRIACLEWLHNNSDYYIRHNPDCYSNMLLEISLYAKKFGLNFAKPRH